MGILGLLLTAIFEGVVFLVRGVVTAGILKVVSSIMLFLTIQMFITYGFGGDVIPEWATPQGFIAMMQTIKSLFTSSAESLNGKTLFENTPSMIYYITDYLAIEYGLATVLNAYVSRFIIRRVFK